MSDPSDQSAERAEVAPEDAGADEEQSSPEEQALLAHRAQLAAKMRHGANWFLLIAGLSVANTVILLMEGNRHFVVGLGITQLVNVLALAIAKQAPEAATTGKVVALVVTLLASAVVAAFAF